MTSLPIHCPFTTPFTTLATHTPIPPMGSEAPRWGGGFTPKNDDRRATVARRDLAPMPGDFCGGGYRGAGSSSLSPEKIREGCLMAITREMRREFYSITRQFSLLRLMDYAFKGCKLHQFPFSEFERVFEEGIVARLNDGRAVDFFHGGLEGRSVGDLLLPGTVTNEAPHEWLDPDWRRRWVYFTPMFEKARAYAADCDGVVYRVCPNGPIGIAPGDCRAIQLIVGSPQYKRAVRTLVAGGYPEDQILENILDYASCTAATATVLEVLG